MVFEKLMKKYYNDATYDHAVRVAKYIEQESHSQTFGTLLGLAHDLLEEGCSEQEIVDELKELKSIPYCFYDTKIKNFINSLKILTHNKTKMTYEEYIDNIFSSKDYWAYLVKKADMKDHFAQYETLTDKLKEKYLPHIYKFL